MSSDGLCTLWVAASGHTHLPVIAWVHAGKEGQIDQHGTTRENCRLGGSSPDDGVARLSAKGRRACLRIDQASYCRVHSEIDLERAEIIACQCRNLFGGRLFRR